MNNIPLYILDEYAKRLTNNQVAMLHEHKCGKPYNKVLNEDITKMYKVYLSESVIFYDTTKDKSEFLLDLVQEDKELMESIQYKIDIDAVEFNTRDPKQYARLMESLSNVGISEESIAQINDENL